MMPTAYASTGPTPEEVRKAVLQALEGQGEVKALSTYERLLKDRNEPMVSLVARHHGSPDLAKRLMDLASLSIIPVSHDLSEISIVILEEYCSFWDNASQRPIKTIREWLRLQGREEQQDQSAHGDLYKVATSKGKISMMLRTSAPHHVLRRSGQQGVFATSSPTDKNLRAGYSVVWAPGQATLAQMQEHLGPECQGIALMDKRMGWRVTATSEQAFRQKVGAAPRSNASMYFEIDGISCATSRVALSKSLASWGWRDVVAIRPSSQPSVGMRSWIVGAPTPPPATSLIMDSCVVDIRDAPKRGPRKTQGPRTAHAPPVARSHGASTRKPVSNGTGWKTHTKQIPATAQWAQRPSKDPTDAILARLEQIEHKLQLRVADLEVTVEAHKAETDDRMRQQKEAHEDKEKWHEAARADQQVRMEKMEGMLAQIMTHVKNSAATHQPAQHRTSDAGTKEPLQKKQKSSATEGRKKKQPVSENSGVRRGRPRRVSSEDNATEHSEAEVERVRRGRPRRDSAQGSATPRMSSKTKLPGASRRTRTRSDN